jgi:hypothetical protein
LFGQLDHLRLTSSTHAPKLNSILILLKAIYGMLY